MSDFRFDKIFLEPFINFEFDLAHNEDDEEDIMIGWFKDEDDFPDNFSEGEYEEEEEIEYFFPEKNLTFDGKV